jgi:CDP-glucose 4,6-dehydratase
MEKMVIDNFNSVFKNTNTFITGHTGFKGSWLAFWLSNLHANVSGLSLEAEKDSHWNDLSMSIVNDNIGDIRNYNFVEDCLLKANPEIVFHLAAQPLVRQSYETPIETWETNVIGTANLLHACRKLDSLKAIIVITSDKCYENTEIDKGYKENDRLGGHDPYSSSKAAVEVLVSSFRRSYFSAAESPRLVTARAGNVVGGGDWSKNRLIPDVVRSSVLGDPLSIRYPKSTRPWQHVLDCNYGYLQLAMRLLSDSSFKENAFNFGPSQNSNATVEEILITIKSFWSSIKWELDDQINPHEAGFLYLDSSLSRDVLNWKPILNLENTLRMTIDWYKNHNKDIICSKNQLSEYTELLQDSIKN